MKSRHARELVMSVKCSFFEMVQNAFFFQSNTYIFQAEIRIFRLEYHGEGCCSQPEVVAMRIFGSVTDYEQFYQTVNN